MLEGTLELNDLYPDSKSSVSSVDLDQHCPPLDADPSVFPTVQAGQTVRDSGVRRGQANDIGSRALNPGGFRLRLPF